MARKPRLTFEGAIHHVTFRGNGRKTIFRCDEERSRFLESLAERAERYRIRLYLYCLMTNHVHLLVETPAGNLSAFMGSLLTSHATYFNLRNRNSGHVTQGRYHSPLVEGDDYLLRLSRYIHLNPVFVGGLKHAPVAERVKALRAYRWSSYRSYVGLAPKTPWMDYEPLLAMMPGRGERARSRRLRDYVETGLAQTDDEMESWTKAKGLGIGSEAFMAELWKRYDECLSGRVKREDVSFRKVAGTIAPERILAAVGKVFGIRPADIRRRRISDRIKPVAAVLLTTKGGLTQREAATQLGLQTGAAVCLQLKRAQTANFDAAKIIKCIEQEFNI